MKLNITPVPKPRMNRNSHWQHKPGVDKYFDYCDQLNLLLPNYKLPGELPIVFILPMPKSWSNKKRLAMVGQPHTQKPDVDNLAKAFMDAFHSDDSHVWHLDAHKYWGVSGEIRLV